MQVYSNLQACIDVWEASNAQAPTSSTCKGRGKHPYGKNQGSTGNSMRDTPSLSPYYAGHMRAMTDQIQRSKIRSPTMTYQHYLVIHPSHPQVHSIIASEQCPLKLRVSQGDPGVHNSYPHTFIPWLYRQRFRGMYTLVWRPGIF
jgi:hypothetical protein